MIPLNKLVSCSSVHGSFSISTAAGTGLEGEETSGIGVSSSSAGVEAAWTLVLAFFFGGMVKAVLNQ